MHRPSNAARLSPPAARGERLEPSHGSRCFELLVGKNEAVVDWRPSMRLVSLLVVACGLIAAGPAPPPELTGGGRTIYLPCNAPPVVIFSPTLGKTTPGRPRQQRRY